MYLLVHVHRNYGSLWVYMGVADLDLPLERETSASEPSSIAIINHLTHCIVRL